MKRIEKLVTLQMKNATIEFKKVQLFRKDLIQNLFSALMLMVRVEAKSSG